MCEKYNITRDEMEQFALASHQKAVAAQQDGRFDREVSDAQCRLVGC